MKKDLTFSFMIIYNMLLLNLKAIIKLLQEKEFHYGNFIRSINPISF